MRKKKRPTRQVKRNLSKDTTKEGNVSSFTPVRGDTVSFWTNDGGFRYALVLTAQDKEATLLTADNDRITLPYVDLKEVYDNRMQMLRNLPDEEAAAHREDYLERWMVRCQDRADQAAIARGAPVDEYGNVIRNKTGRKPNDEKVRRVNELCDQFIDFVEKSDQPVTKRDLGDMIPASVYSDVINAAVETGKVAKNGSKRGTNYTVPGRTYEVASEDKSVPTVEPEVLNVVVEFIGTNGPTSKSELISHFGLSTTEWTSVRYVLQNDDRVRIEGERRGTRYVRN